MLPIAWPTLAWMAKTPVSRVAARIRSTWSCGAASSRSSPALRACLRASSRAVRPLQSMNSRPARSTISSRAGGTALSGGRETRGGCYVQFPAGTYLPSTPALLGAEGDRGVTTESWRPAFLAPAPARHGKHLGMAGAGCDAARQERSLCPPRRCYRLRARSADSAMGACQPGSQRRSPCCRGGSARYAGRARRHAVSNANRGGHRDARSRAEGGELRRSCATWPPVVQDGLALPARCALCEPAGPCCTGLLGWLHG